MYRVAGPASAIILSGNDAYINPHLHNGLSPGYDLITITTSDHIKRLIKQKNQREMKQRGYND